MCGRRASRRRASGLGGGRREGSDAGAGADRGPPSPLPPPTLPPNPVSLTGVHVELAAHGPRVGVPHDRGAVDRPREQQPRRVPAARRRARPAQREDGALVAGQGADERAVGRPQARRAVVRAGGQKAAPGRPLQCGHVPRRPSIRRRVHEHGGRRARGRVGAPEAGGAVARARGQGRAVGRPRHRKHLCRVAIQRVHRVGRQRRAVARARARAAGARGAPLAPVGHHFLQVLHVLGQQVGGGQGGKVGRDGAVLGRGGEGGGGGRSRFRPRTRRAPPCLPLSLAPSPHLANIGLQLQILQPLLHERDERPRRHALVAAGLVRAVHHGFVAKDKGGMGEAWSGRRGGGGGMGGGVGGRGGGGGRGARLAPRSCSQHAPGTSLHPPPRASGRAPPGAAGAPPPSRVARPRGVWRALKPQMRPHHRLFHPHNPHAAPDSCK